MKRVVKKRRTIAEWIEKRHPEYSTKTHFVLINDVLTDSSKLNSPLAPLDVVEVQPRK